MELYNKLLNKIKELQESGVPLLFFRDPRTKLPSVSLTMMLISFLLVLVGLINKWAQLVQGIELNNAMELLYVTSGLYFGRAISKRTYNAADQGKGEDK
jgi:hypothetical protein